MSDATEQGGGIAIVGMSLRVPGASTPEQYWKNLLAGVESILQRSDDELLAAGESAARLADPRYVKASAILKNMEQFDPEFFGLSPKEGGIMDPQHRQLLECAWEALEDAGHMPDAFDGPIGVWAGCGMGAYFTYNILSNRDLVDSTGLFLLRHTGNDKDFLATRISYALDLRGPSIGVQTACSTSLVAAHYACQSLLSGECDMALAGGVTIELPHGRGYMFEEGEILSPDGHCRAFDHKSAGTVFGSGAGIVVLRRLEDAIADGDRIYAVIKGSAVNNDGSGKVGYLAPSVEGQAAAVAEALAVAGVSADTIGYVECHGTGTAVGDPIEVAALSNAFRETTDKRGYCAIGSVKTNIGHLDAAAGVASLIKAALCVKHGQIPPSLNFEKPNPLIDFGSTPFFVNDKARAFPEPKRGQLRRASVNSLGVGGTNVHMVLEAPPAAAAPTGTKPETEQRAELLVLSGRQRSVLDASATRLVQHLREHPESALADVAYTLQTARKHFSERRVLVCRDREHAIAQLAAADPRKVFTHSVNRSATVVFMFPGGGAQYPGMGRRLYEKQAVFREHVDRGLLLLSARVQHDPRALLFPDPSDGAACAQAALALEQPSLQLPLIYIVEYALAQLWLSWGVKPAALIGHSVGENTAAAVAGVISFEDGLSLVLLRGLLFDEVPPGGMIGVPLPAAELRPLLGDDLDLACVNAPDLSVASGPRASLDRLQALLAERDVQTQSIRIKIAAHSRMLEPILGRFGDFLRKTPLSAPRIPILSNRTGDLLNAEQACSPEYWVEHLRNTVRFGDGIAKLLEEPGRVFLEVGPGRVLSSLARAHPKVAQGQAFIGSLPHPDDDTPDDEVFLAACGRLWAAGVPLDLARTRAPGKATRVALPSYAFAHQRYWIEPQAPRVSDAPPANPRRIQDPERTFFAPTWRQHSPDLELDASPHTWLVFSDETGLGADLIRALRASGNHVICVRAGDAFGKLSDSEYRLAPEQGSEGYELLLREVVASGKLPERIAHLWLLTEDESFRPGSSFFERNQERGFFSLLFLAQALAALELSSPLGMFVISRGLRQAGSARVLYPDQATVLGPCKVIPRELRGVTCSSIDLEGAPREVATSPVTKLRTLAERLLPVPLAGDDAAHAARRSHEVAALLRELTLPLGSREVVLSREARWERRYEHMTLPLAARSGLRRRGVYLITGGFGGVGLALARSLAETEQARLVLVNRTPLPAREAWDDWLKRRPRDATSARIRLARQLEQLGGELLVLSGDVADRDRMTEVVAEAKAHFGALHGVIHAAGVLDDAPIAVKREPSVTAVFRPKVYGTQVLGQVLSKEPLDFLVLCSSLSTAIAAAGQVDYVAANAFLDAYAEQARASGRNVLSLAWGVWSEVGLGAAAAAQLDRRDVPRGREAPASYPAFEAKAIQASGPMVLRGTLRADTLWFLDEHRTANGHAVLPGTGYLELARAALRELGHKGPFEIDDLYFLRPLELQEGQALGFRVRLSPSGQDFGFELQSKQRLKDGSEGYLLHAQALLRRTPAAQPPPLELAAIRDRCNIRVLPPAADEYRLAQEKHLRFGGRWRNLRSVAFGVGEAVAQLSLRAAYRSELATFALHPGLLDIASGFAIELEPSYGSGDALWVPVSYERVSVYGDLTAELSAHVRLQKRDGVGHALPERGGLARFDITLCDEVGRVLVDIAGLSMQAIASESFVTHAPRARDLEQDTSRHELTTAERAFLHNVSEGITPAQGVAAFRRVVDTMDTMDTKAPRAHVIVSSLEVRELVRQADAMAATHEPTSAASFERPSLSSDYLAPRTDAEGALATMWESLLGVHQIGVRDNFFELGGHSLIAVRLFARMKKTFGVDYPISTLIDHPTIESCARLIAPVEPAAGVSESRSRKHAAHGQRFKHLVPMTPASDDHAGRLPFFLVAGMFGNVINLRNLAGLLGEDRAFYGIQARGLRSDEQPHETFEDMARDYLAELRVVQPHGPYLLGGFSGGGLAAYELAQQLTAAGEQVALLVLLDTPLPSDEPLTRAEKLSIHRQNLEREGPRYLVSWATQKLAYRIQQHEREAQAADPHDADSADARSRVIEKAFYRALARYRIKPAPLHLLLCRPRLKATHVFGPGRAINQDRRRIYYDNGWTPYGARVDVFEAPGDHDSMVLEPNVRILAEHLRAVLNAAEREAKRPHTSGATSPVRPPVQRADGE